MPGFNIRGEGAAGALSATVEMGRAHRWKIAILGSDNGTIKFTEYDLFYAHSAQPPMPEIDKITMHHGQDEIYYPGKNRWKPVEFKFYRPIYLSIDTITRNLYLWWSSVMVNTALSKISGPPDTYKGSCQYELTSGTGAPIYKYELIGCWPASITPDNLDYTETKLAEIAVTFNYDKARETTVIVERALAGIGRILGRTI